MLMLLLHEDIYIYIYISKNVLIVSKYHHEQSMILIELGWELMISLYTILIFHIESMINIYIVFAEADWVIKQ